MGQPSSKNSFPESRYYIVLDYKYCKVWKRRDNQKETMQQYQVFIQNQQELIKYQKMWQIRTQQESVVNVFYFYHHYAQQMCSLSRNASILTERIPYRLSQFRNIPYQEMLSIMKACFKVFKILYDEYGLFKIKSTMLGINCQHKLKVWHHTDFSNPQPENTNCKSLLEMLKSIVNAIQLNSDQPFQYVRFSQFLDVNKDRYNANFDQILSVFQTYRLMNNIPLSQSLPQIKYYMRKVEGEDQQSSNTYLNTNNSRQAYFNVESPQREIISSHNESLAYINSSSALKHNTCNRVFPALHQSRKTIKRNPSINIYTHKEINRILESQKQLSNYLVTRQQRLKSPPSNLTHHTPPKLFHHFNQILRSNFIEQPKVQRNQVIYRGDPLGYSPTIINRDINSGYINLQNRRSLNSFEKKLQKRQSSMNRDIYYRMDQRLGRLDERNISGTDRTARFEISTVRSNSLNNSKSKQSSFIFL